MASMCTVTVLMSLYTFCVLLNVTARHLSKHIHSRVQGLQKIYTRLPLCSSLKPESVTTDTICLSSCGNDASDPNLVCNPQAETWNTRLKVDVKSSFIVSDDCPSEQKRFKCIGYESNEIECTDATFDTYPEGFTCYTSCGQLKCPSHDFITPSVTNDFKLADCQSSYRVRCRIHPNSEHQQIGIPDLTMELQLGDLRYPYNVPT